MMGRLDAVERSEALARLGSARVGRIATVRPNGRPHVVPFVFAVVEERERVRVYWAVDDKPKRSSMLQRLRNLERNPSVEIVVDFYDEDWNRLWWVRATGTGRVVDEAAERAAALDALRAKYPQYREAELADALVAVDVESITGWMAAPE
jgi:PPOX class probable F420-dependent enzyme